MLTKEGVLTKKGVLTKPFHEHILYFFLATVKIDFGVFQT